MSEFVKLTGTNGETVGVRASSIVGISQSTRSAVSVIYVGDMSDDHVCYVTETPEQIIALIDGPPDRDEMANELAEALKVCISQIEHLHAKFQTTESGNATIAYAKDAIALWESLK